MVGRGIGEPTGSQVCIRKVSCFFMLVQLSLWRQAFRSPAHQAIHEYMDIAFNPLPGIFQGRYLETVSGLAMTQTNSAHKTHCHQRFFVSFNFQRLFYVAISATEGFDDDALHLAQFTWLSIVGHTWHRLVIPFKAEHDCMLHTNICCLRG